MTKEQISLIKNSWLAASANPDLVGALFYGRLFEIAPEVKPMFSRTTVTEQSRKLLAMLSYVISKLDRLEEIIDEVAKLALRHRQYGVSEDHYRVVGEALLWTLQKGLGDAWTEELETAWTTCYTTLASAMIAAAGHEQKDAA